MRSTIELAVEDPGVVTGMSDKTSPDYTNLYRTPKGLRRPVTVVTGAPET